MQNSVFLKYTNKSFYIPLYFYLFHFNISDENSML